MVHDGLMTQQSRDWLIHKAVAAPENVLLAVQDYMEAKGIGTRHFQGGPEPAPVRGPDSVTPIYNKTKWLGARDDYKEMIERRANEAQGKYAPLAPLIRRVGYDLKTRSAKRAFKAQLIEALTREGAEPGTIALVHHWIDNSVTEHGPE